MFDQYLKFDSSNILLNSSSDLGNSSEYSAPIYLAISSKVLPSAYLVRDFASRDYAAFASS